MNNYYINDFEFPKTFTSFNLEKIPAPNWSIEEKLSWLESRGLYLWFDNNEWFISPDEEFNDELPDDVYSLKDADKNLVIERAFHLLAR